MHLHSVPRWFVVRLTEQCSTLQNESRRSPARLQADATRQTELNRTGMSGDFIRWEDEVPWHVRLLTP
jgi:hypothetical protein